MKKNNVSKILKIDPYLEPFKTDIELRASLFEKKRQELLGKNRSIVDFASGYEYFGGDREKPCTSENCSGEGR